jgi:hypothetical protein
VFALALERFRQACEARGKQVHFRIFQAYDLEDGPRMKYQDIARQFEVSVTDVTNYLHFARNEFRRTVLDTLRELTVSTDEFQQDARFLLRGGH